MDVPNWYVSRETWRLIVEEMSKYEARERRMRADICIDTVKTICVRNGKPIHWVLQEIGQDRFTVETEHTKLFEGCFAELSLWCNGFIAGIRHK